MEYFLKLLLTVCVVLYIMDVISGINYVIRIRNFNRFFEKTFEGKEEEEIAESEADYWQEYYKHTVNNAFTLFIAFVICSLIFSVMLIIFNN